MSSKAQQIIDIIRGKKQYVRNYIKPENAPKGNKLDINVIAVCGFYYSGSSAVADLLDECSDMTSYSLHHKIFSGGRKQYSGAEMTFFVSQESIFNLIDKYYGYDNMPLEKDLAIKSFIRHVNDNYNLKKQPDIFNKNFMQITHKLLDNILNLDEYTKAFMADKMYPSTVESKSDEYSKCTFIQGEGINQYAYYSFKNMPDIEFNQHIQNYMHDFFNNISKTKYLVCDQMFLQTQLLDKMNYFMGENPIKEICVYRDPRDQYMVAFRNDTRGYLKRNVKNFIKSYKKTCISKLNSYSPNRLCIRLEDLIFDYQNTTNKIFKFIGMPKKNHICPKKFFNPEISKAHVGSYKLFYNQKMMKEIEQALPQYCYRDENNFIKDSKSSTISRLEGGGWLLSA